MLNQRWVQVWGTSVITYLHPFVPMVSRYVHCTDLYQICKPASYVTYVLHLRTPRHVWNANAARLPLRFDRTLAIAAQVGTVKFREGALPGDCGD